MRKGLSLFCLCIILFSTLVVAFHHHADGREHDDCLICTASLQHSHAVIAVVIHNIQSDFAGIEFFTPTSHVIETFFYPFISRAPPA